MKIDFDLLQKSNLFNCIEQEELMELCTCIDAKVKTYGRGEFIACAGDEMKNIGIVLSGQAQIIKEDIFGNRAILNTLKQGDVFGESFVCSKNNRLTVSFEVCKNADILLLNFERIMHVCEKGCKFHHRLMKNMICLIANKNLKLFERLEISTKRTLRDKVLAYLSLLSQEQGSLVIESPLGRTEMADFLCVNRSALTRELTQMEKDCLILYKKNSFTLLNFD